MFPLASVELRTKITGMEALEKLLSIEFLPNPAREEEGLGHAGIETYRNEPYAGAARETGQNSRDAARELPVRISYDVLEIVRTEIAGIDGLEKVIATCLAQAKGKDKDESFFCQALKVVRQPVLKVLRIADFNTTGARGPAIPGTPFHSLVKASGVSVKENAASGGSFGIGKNAVFAVSDLRTVFYSTVYEADGENKFLAQGKSVLASHQGEDGQPKRQVGYWGLPDFREVDDAAAVPAWLRRTQVGTSVFVLGFRDTPDWQNRISYSLIQNFFPAIQQGAMEFTLDGGRYEIGRGTLSALFEDDAILAAAKANDRVHEFELARNLHRCLVSSEAREDILTLPLLGRVQVRVLVEPNLPKKIFIVRNGMLITDSLEHFGDRFVRFPMYQDFVALVTPVEEAGRAFIKKLEDPRHLELSAEGLPDVASRTMAKDVMKRLAKKVRDIIKTHAMAKAGPEVSADEMSDYFATGADPTGHKKSPNDDPEKIEYKIEPRNDRPRSQAAGAGAGQPGSGVGGGGTGPGPKPGSGDGKPNLNPKPPPGGTPGAGQLRPIGLAGVRTVKSASGGGRARTIFFTPAEGGLANIALQATGLSTTEDLVVLSSSKGEVSDGRIRCQVEANQRARIDVEFDDDYDGPVEVRVQIDETCGGAPQ